MQANKKTVATCNEQAKVSYDAQVKSAQNVQVIIAVVKSSPLTIT